MSWKEFRFFVESFPSKGFWEDFHGRIEVWFIAKKVTIGIDKMKINEHLFTVLDLTVAISVLILKIIKHWCSLNTCRGSTILVNKWAYNSDMVLKHQVYLKQSFDLTKIFAIQKQKEQYLNGSVKRLRNHISRPFFYRWELNYVKIFCSCESV